MHLRPRKKCPCVLRSCLPTPSGPDEQWEMDFVSDSLGSGRRIRILTILDLWDRSTPALEVDISLSGQRVAQVAPIVPRFKEICLTIAGNVMYAMVAKLL